MPAEKIGCDRRGSVTNSWLRSERHLLHRLNLLVPDEIRLERSRRGMVGTVGELAGTMERHNFPAHSRLFANRYDFGDRSRVCTLDAFSEGLLRRAVGC